MKKNIFYLGILGVITMGLLACEKEKLAPTKKQEKVIESSSSARISGLTVGEEHNYMLDVYYDKLEEFIINNDISDVTPQVVKGLMEDEILSPYYSDINEDVHGTLSDEFANILNEVPTDVPTLVNSTNYSSEFKSEALDLLTDMADPNLNISSTQEKDAYCAAWIVKINARLTNSDEKQILLDAIDVFDHSYDYWVSNMSKWKTLIDPNGTAPTPSALSIVGADVAGGVMGAMAGVIAGGIGAGPGALGGAIIGSVGQAVADFWDWLGW